jgi:hypothetical protein
MCTDGYGGLMCQTPPVDPCSTLNCGAHGSCTAGRCVCTGGYLGAQCNIEPGSCPSGKRFCQGTTIQQCNADGATASTLMDCSFMNGTQNLYLDHCNDCGGGVGPICAPANGPDCSARFTGVTSFDAVATTSCKKNYCYTDASAVGGDSLTLSIVGSTTTATTAVLHVKVTTTGTNAGSFGADNTFSVTYPPHRNDGMPQNHHCATSTSSPPGSIQVTVPELPLKIGDKVSFIVNGMMSCDVTGLTSFSLSAQSSIWHAN